MCQDKNITRTVDYKIVRFPGRLEKIIRRIAYDLYGEVGKTLFFSLYLVLHGCRPTINGAETLRWGSPSPKKI